MWDPMHSTAKLSLQCTCLGFTQVCPSAAEGVEGQLQQEETARLSYKLLCYADSQYFIVLRLSR